MHNLPLAPQSTPTDVSASPSRLTWTVEEAAICLGISRPTAYEAVKTGAIPHIKIGRRILIPVSALKRMLALVAGEVTE